MNQRAGLGAWLLGLGLIALGVLFLLDTMDVLDAGSFFSTFWPLALIAWGTWMLVQEHGRSLWGLIVLLLGIGFLSEELGWIEGGWLGRFWPLALIIVGLAILVGARSPRARPAGRRAEEKRTEDVLDTVVVMGERNQFVAAATWRGGRVVAVMGEANVDLREATPHPDGTRLTATAVLGSVNLKVPAEWDVSIAGTPVLGSIEDRTSNAPPPAPRTRSKGRPHVEIVATAVLGEIEIEH